MRQLLPITLLLIALLSGCNSNSENSSKQKDQGETTIEATTKQEAQVIYNSAKSQRVLSENQVKSNVSYTHLGVSGARYATH